MAIGEANGNSSTFTINNYRLHRKIVWVPCAVSIIGSLSNDDGDAEDDAK